MRAYVYGEQRDLPAGFETFVDPSVTAVISIDMHRGHLEDDPACPCPAPRAREIVEPMNAFHNKVRALGIPVIHVTTVLRASGADDVKGIPSAWRLVFPLHVGPIPNSDAHALEGSKWTEFVTEVAETDHVVTGKRRLSAFYPTDLDFLLRNLGIKTVVFDGGFTDCCVLNASFDASNLNYRVVVLKDLVRGTDPSMEDAALKIVSLHLGLVMDSDEILTAWGAEAAAAAE
ncbi:cysteine hydrolase family protein [Methylobrevis pamukkalensis]|uniref:N-carbamoylsarcosine amidase n=1 Tax=Methylobrevis pamukkalensis TaxID=1439726 RepID=A0A1E3H484_9HYPH|nr:isochorismatase family cysteine hydrolase [Methylobrevis pamukkalensis]ODN71122.1 N-carbamoylsarcosine amidase [Methylobrevis pamukkalensis]